MAIFDDSGVNTTVNLSASRSPGTTIVNNAAATYAIGGSPIAGTGSLVKSGSAALTLNGTNTFTGGATLNAGLITLGVSSVGSGSSVTSGPLGRGALILGGGKLQMTQKRWATTFPWRPAPRPSLTTLAAMAIWTAI